MAVRVLGCLDLRPAAVSCEEAFGICTAANGAGCTLAAIGWATAEQILQRQVTELRRSWPGPSPVAGCPPEPANPSMSPGSCQASSSVDTALCRSRRNRERALQWLALRSGLRGATWPASRCAGLFGNEMRE